MSTTIDEITMNYEEEGTLIVKEIDKEILSKGLYCTILFRYQEWSNEAQDYGADKYSIRRYKKVQGEFRQQSKFNISSKKQALIVIETLNRWMNEEESDDEYGE